MLTSTNREINQKAPRSRRSSLTAGSTVVTVILISILALDAPSLGLGVSHIFDKGLAAARKGDLPKAILLWSRVIELRPDSYAARINRGFALIKSGHVIKGVNDWSESIDLAPSFAFQTHCSDYALGFKGNGPVKFVRPIELDPEHVASVIMAGALCLDLGRRDQAKDLFEKSIDLTRNPLLKNRFDHWAKSLDQ
jgi:tetratricopeptide (TPR) repeat protein